MARNMTLPYPIRAAGCSRCSRAVDATFELPSRFVKLKAKRDKRDIDAPQNTGGFHFIFTIALVGRSLAPPPRTSSYVG